MTDWVFEQFLQAQSKTLLGYVGLEAEKLFNPSTKYYYIQLGPQPKHFIFKQK